MPNTLKKILLLIAAIGIVQIGFSQCAMCTATAEEAMRNGSSATASLNKGVLFLFCMPYLVIATIGFFWWKARKKALSEKTEQHLS